MERDSREEEERLAHHMHQEATTEQSGLVEAEEAPLHLRGGGGAQSGDAGGGKNGDGRRLSDYGRVADLQEIR